MLLLALPISPGAHAKNLNWQTPIEIASGNAIRGPWRMNDSDFNFVDDPSIAVSDEGLIAIVWADNARQDIFLQVIEGNGSRRFAEPVNISRSNSTFSWLPRLVLEGENAENIYVLWQEIVFSGGSHGGEIYFARSQDGGHSFAKPLNLSNTQAGAGKGRMSEHRWQNGSLDLAIDEEGKLYAAWTEYEGALRFSRSDNRGRGFSKPQRINNDSLPALGPSLAVHDNHVYIAWAVGEDPAADIHLAQSNNGGKHFQQPSRIHSGDSHASAPRIATDAHGQLHLVYADALQGPFSGHRIHYSYLDHSFSDPLTVSGESSADIHGLGFPALQVDEQGSIYILWEIFTDNPFRSQGLGLSYRHHTEQNFSPAITVPGTRDPALGWNGSQQGLFMNKLALDPRGGVAVVNSSFKPGERSAIWLMRAALKPSERSAVLE